uniref:Uncharacterized protein n=1 Tax=Nelumbo nucifera TaxID=4432 RepID=A0A822XZN5_NELNU|nr:TPA_asm: hypothetical protein HUJ06_024311 [Nelumbo nucifera]
MQSKPQSCNKESESISHLHQPCRTLWRVVGKLRHRSTEKLGVRRDTYLSNDTWTRLAGHHIRRMKKHLTNSYLGCYNNDKGDEEGNVLLVEHLNSGDDVYGVNRPGSELAKMVINTCSLTLKVAVTVADLAFSLTIFSLPLSLSLYGGDRKSFPPANVIYFLTCKNDETLARPSVVVASPAPISPSSSNASARKKMKPIGNKERVLDLQLDLEKDDRESCSGETCSIHLFSVADDYSGLARRAYFFGYMPPLQAVVSMDGSSGSLTPSQRPKRCATHSFLACSCWFCIFLWGQAIQSQCCAPNRNHYSGKPIAGKLTKESNMCSSKLRSLLLLEICCLFILNSVVFPTLQWILLDECQNFGSKDLCPLGGIAKIYFMIFWFYPLYVFSYVLSSIWY